MEEKNFGLTELEFNTLVANLKNGDELLFERVFLMQFKQAMNYVIFKHKARKEEAYDATMDALIKFRVLLIEEKVNYGNLTFLFSKMASQNFLKGIRRASKIELRETLPEITSNTDSYSEEEKLVLNKAWSQLGKECQVILKSFFYKNMKSQEIGELLNKSAVAVRKQKERCIHTLRVNFQKIV